MNLNERINARRLNAFEIFLNGEVQFIASTLIGLSL